MNHGRLLFHYLMVFVFAGCACPAYRQGGAASLLRDGTAEYSISTHESSERIVVSSLGASRIDIRSDASERTFLLSCSPREARRLIGVTEAIIASPAAVPIELNRPYEGHGKIRFRCRRGACESATEISYIQLDRNLVWKGLVNEFELVSSAGLARSINYFESGESLGKGGNELQTFYAYDNAAIAFSEWSGAYVDRHMFGIYEPEIAMEFQYRDNQGKIHTFSGFRPTASRSILDLPGMTMKEATPVLRYIWREYTKGLTVTTSGKVFVVESQKDSLFIDLRPVPRELATELMQLPSFDAP